MKYIALALAALMLAGCGKTGALDQRFNATDGKIAGIIPDEAAAPIVAKAYKPAGDWLSQQADMARLYHAMPEGLVLNYGIRLKGTEDGWVDLSNYEQVYWFDPIVSALTMSAPNFGSRVRPTPVIAKKPLSSAVPAAEASPPPVGGNGAADDLLNGDANSTIEASK